jgi:hypothetical protein
VRRRLAGASHLDRSHRQLSRLCYGRPRLIACSCELAGTLHLRPLTLRTPFRGCGSSACAANAKAKPRAHPVVGDDARQIGVSQALPASCIASAAGRAYFHFPPAVLLSTSIRAFLPIARTRCCVLPQTVHRHRSLARVYQKRTAAASRCGQQLTRQQTRQVMRSVIGMTFGSDDMGVMRVRRLLGLCYSRSRRSRVQTSLGQ